MLSRSGGGRKRGLFCFFVAWLGGLEAFEASVLVAPLLPGAVFFLALFVQFEEARDCWFARGHLVGDVVAEGLEVVAGDGGEHVVFGVVFHAPVEE